MTRRQALKVGAGAAAGSLFAPAITRAAGSTIKIGYVGALSGIRAAFGETESWTIEKMKAHLANGLDVGGKTYQVELVIRDNQSDPNRSTSIASELALRERCNLVLAQDGDGAISIGELADTRRVPTISTMVPWQGWFFPRGGNPETGFPYTFHFFAGSDTILQTFVALMGQVETNKKVGTLFLNNEPGQAFMDPQLGLPPLLEQAGYSETAGGGFPITANDFSNTVSAFAAANPDILTGFMYPNHFIPFWNQIGQAGLSPKVCAMAAAFLFPSGLEALGDSGDGMATEVWWSPRFPYGSTITGQSAEALAAAGEKESGRQWTQPLGYGHALWEVGLAALQRSGDPTDPDMVRDAIASLNMETVIGPVNFAGSPIKSVAVTGLAGGQWRKGTGKHPYELKIVDNTALPAVPIEAEMVPLGGA
ncbi:ABC transporter substrate-binding protein [Sulfitobacter sp. THAF37]|uniref:ABC transporter substrate-binding protein n=1 Tax=Sulfitobacter sp. THAF37 TaxID=2587855 RepID=UPI0012679D45|nr:ABC transporter substrate-binding protein [Sulfitobacter sp. THAF37]